MKFKRQKDWRNKNHHGTVNVTRFLRKIVEKSVELDNIAWCGQWLFTKLTCIEGTPISSNHFEENLASKTQPKSSCKIRSHETGPFQNHWVTWCFFFWRKKKQLFFSFLSYVDETKAIIWTYRQLPALRVENGSAEPTGTNGNKKPMERSLIERFFNRKHTTWVLNMLS